MTRALYGAFLIGCCVLLLIFGGPWVFLGVLGIAAVGALVRSHRERLERRATPRDPRDP